MTQRITPLIVRPQPAADELARILCQHGIQAEVYPLLTYQPGSDLPHVPDALLQADIVIATSAAATRFCCEYLRNIPFSWPRHICYLAVGVATAAPWQALQIPVMIPAQESSEGLLALHELQLVAHQNIVLLKGEQGRELLSDELTRLGAHVHPLTCYQRHYATPLADNGHSLYSQWQAKQIDSVIITSNELFQHLISLLPDHAHAWLASLTWFAASARIAETIQQAGFSSIVIMSGARHNAVLAALEKQLEGKHDE